MARPIGSNNIGSTSTMRCLACNVELTDFEATRKYSNTDEFIDLCNRCHASSQGYDLEYEEEYEGSIDSDLDD